MEDNYYDSCAFNYCLYFDVSGGTFSLYTEFSAKNGKFIGYIMSVVNNFKVVGTIDRHDSLLDRLYEALVGVAAAILKNPNERQIATKIPLEGKFETTIVDT